MIDWLDEALSAFLRATVPLDPADVQVTFDAPDRTWSSRLDGPSVNLFLWDVRRSENRARQGITETFDDEGNVRRRAAAPWFDLHYLVSAWANDVRDEHRLLGRVLLACLGEGRISPAFLPAGLAATAPPQLAIPPASRRPGGDPWGALDGQLKATLDLVVSTELDAALLADAGPPVTQVRVATGPMPNGAGPPDRWVAGSVLGETEPGARVLSPRGTAVVRPDGSFVIRARAGDEVYLADQPELRYAVPETGPILVG